MVVTGFFCNVRNLPIINRAIASYTKMHQYANVSHSRQLDVSMSNHLAGAAEAELSTEGRAGLASARSLRQRSPNRPERGERSRCLDVTGCSFCRLEERADRCPSTTARAEAAGHSGGRRAGRTGQRDDAGASRAAGGAVVVWPPQARPAAGAPQLPEPLPSTASPPVPPWRSFRWPPDGGPYVKHGAPLPDFGPPCDVLHARR